MAPDDTARATARRIVDEVLAGHAHSGQREEPTPAAPPPSDGPEPTPAPKPEAQEPDTPARRAARRIVEEVLSTHASADTAPPAPVHSEPVSPLPPTDVVPEPTDVAPEEGRIPPRTAVRATSGATGEPSSDDESPEEAARRIVATVLAAHPAPAPPAPEPTGPARPAPVRSAPEDTTGGRAARDDDEGRAPSAAGTAGEVMRVRVDDAQARAAFRRSADATDPLHVAHDPVPEPEPELELELEPEPEPEQDAERDEALTDELFADAVDGDDESDAAAFSSTAPTEQDPGRDGPPPIPAAARKTSDDAWDEQTRDVPGEQTPDEPASESAFEPSPPTAGVSDDPWASDPWDDDTWPLTADAAPTEQADEPATSQRLDGEQHWSEPSAADLGETRPSDVQPLVAQPRQSPVVARPRAREPMQWVPSEAPAPAEVDVLDPDPVAAPWDGESQPVPPRAAPARGRGRDRTQEPPSAPRRTGRWLVTTVIAAVALAVLFPLAIGALLELVSLS